VPFTDAEYEVIEFIASVDRDLTTRPTDAEPGPPISGNHPAPNLETVDLGAGTYAIFDATGGYNTMFVDLGRSVFVIEPVISAEVARAVNDKIRETLPGKPIEYVALTHYHYDHSGGLWGYLTEGTTIVANPGDVEFIHEVANASRTLDELCTLESPPRIETVNGKRVYGRGAHTVELYQVGPNPHVDEMLIAYIPSLKLMYVADVYNYNGRVTPAGDQTLALADKLEALGLEIERIIPTHGVESTGAQFWESVRLGKEVGS
jgi:glyoxylase-like metal-dependent hydrolase (beta-lactamase superfamily II)